MGPGRGENQPQHAFSFSFLSITGPEPWLTGQELGGFVRLPHPPQRKTCLRRKKWAQGNMYL